MLMMQYKLESANGTATFCYSIKELFEDAALQVTRLTKSILSVFHNNESNSLVTASEHLQYEVLHFDGEVNISNSILMKEKLFKSINNSKSILLDMTKLNFIDSSGIATLIEGFHKAQSSGLKFVIVGASNLPLKMLELSKLDQVFTLVNSIQDIYF